MQVKTIYGEPVDLLIPAALDVDFRSGFYFAPIAPANVGNYVAIIKSGNVQIGNSPFHFTVGSKLLSFQNQLFVFVFSYSLAT
jgi:hypothetical protein